MAEHAVGDRVTLTGTIAGISGDIAIVRMDGAEPGQTTIVMLLARLPDAAPSDEDRIRDAMAGARDHPGRTITR